MREVEPEPIRRHERAILLHVRPQDLAQGGVEQVGRGMVLRRILTARWIDDRVHLLPLAKEPAADDALVHDHRRNRLGGFPNLDAAFRPLQESLIAHLAAALRIEGRHIEQQLDLLPLLRLRRRAVADQNGLHQPVRLQPIVADEFRRPDPARQFIHHWAHRRRLEGRRLPGPLPLLVQGPLESRLIELESLFATGFADQIERKAVGVVQLEDRVAGQRRLVRRLCLLHQIGEDR